MLQGVSSADTHHSANAMLIGPDGWLYWSRGIFNVAAFETPTKTYRSGSSGVHRFNPRTFEMEFHYPIGPNPHGDVFDRWGYQFANDGTSGTGGYVSIGKGQRPGNRQWFKKEWRPVAATGVLSSSHFPPESQNNFLVCNCIGFLGVLQYEVQTNGAQITAHRTADLLRSTDDNFRPTDIEVGGDGALYVSDWHNALIGHMQHNMRDPNRDHSHGRIYRITAKNRPLLKPVKLKGKPESDVLRSLFAKENGARYRARLELSGRPSDAVLDAVAAFTSTLNPALDDPDRDEAQALLECLWIHEEHRVPNKKLVEKTFQAAEPRVRAAAIRTLGHWADRVDGWEPLLMAAATDSSALVRAEAVKAAVNFEGLAAAEAVFEAATRETDPELNDVLDFARGQINVDAMVADAIKSGKPVSKAAEAYALQRADAKLLLQMKKTAAVFNALVHRAAIPQEYRWQALEALAQSAGHSPTTELIAHLQRGEQQNSASLSDLAEMLATANAQQLASMAPLVQKLAGTAAPGKTRQAAYAAWMRAGSVADAWRQAMQSRESLADAMASLRWVKDQQKLSQVYALVRPLMFELPEHLRSDADEQRPAAGPSVSYEYYKPNPKNVAKETLDQRTPQLTGKMDGFATFVPGGAKDAFATRQTAGLAVPASGRYVFTITSDDGSRLYLDGKLLINNDGLHGMVAKSGAVELIAGVHEIVVTYFDNGGGDGLVIQWEGPGMARQQIAPHMLRPKGGANLRARAVQVVADLKGNVAQNIDDFAKLTASESLGRLALDELAQLPGAKVAAQLASADAQRIIEQSLKNASEATPVERQSPEFSRLLSLSASLVAKADVDAKAVSRSIASLRASIPVKADPQQMALGKEVYSRESHCATCHQPHGQGLPNLYPPLDGSLWATGSSERMIALVLDGMHGTIEVKGKRYSSPPLPPMTGFRHLLNDGEIAAVVTYVRNTWSNRARPVTAKDVARIRAIDRGQDAAFWFANNLMAKYPLEDGRKPIESEAGSWTPKFVKEWKIEDFDLAKFSQQARSFDEGLLAFKRVGCAQCHKLGDTGGVFGPNLAELDAKKRNLDYVLNAIVSPSKDVDPRFVMHTYRLEDGEVVSGMIVKETATEVHLVSDPLKKDMPTVVAKDSIEATAKTVKSVMPKGLLNWLTEDQIMDLAAFVLAGGDPKHSVYQK